MSSPVRLQAGRNCSLGRCPLDQRKHRDGYLCPGVSGDERHNGGQGGKRGSGSMATWHGIDDHSRCTCEVNPWCPQHGRLVAPDQRPLQDWQKEFDLRAVLARIVAARDALSPQFHVPADLEIAINGGRMALGSRCEATKWGEYNPLRCARSKGHTGEHAYVVDGEYDVKSSR